MPAANRLLPSEIVPGEDDVDVHGQPRHVLEKQIQRSAALQREFGAGEDGRRHIQQLLYGPKVRGVQLGLFRFSRSPVRVADTQRLPPPKRSLWARAMVCHGKASSCAKV